MPYSTIIIFASELKSTVEEFMCLSNKYFNKENNVHLELQGLLGNKLNDFHFRRRFINLPTKSCLF